MKVRVKYLAFVAATLVAASALAAGFLTNNLPVAGGAQYPSTLPLSGLEQFPADTGLPSGANPASEAIQVGQLLQPSSASASNATSFTSTVAQVENGAYTILLLTGAPTAAQNVTTPTATLMAGAIPSAASLPYKYLLKFVNVGGTSSGVWTVVGGSNVTVTGNATVAVAGSRTFLVTVTSASAVTLQDYGT